MRVGGVLVVSLRSLRLPGGYVNLCVRAISQQNAADTVRLKFTASSIAASEHIFHAGTHQQELKVF